MWWGWVLFTMRPEIAAWTPHLHAVVRGTLFQGTDSGPRAHLRGGCEPAGGAKTCTLRQHGMTGDWGTTSARAALVRRARAISLPSVTSTVVSIPAAD
jgi:hypothetical protein